MYLLGRCPRCPTLSLWSSVVLVVLHFPRGPMLCSWSYVVLVVLRFPRDPPLSSWSSVVLVALFVFLLCPSSVVLKCPCMVICCHRSPSLSSRSFVVFVVPFFSSWPSVVLRLSLWSFAVLLDLRCL